MGKKKSSNAQTPKALKAAKKAKAAQKTERKEKKKIGKAKDEFEDDQDLEAILENVLEHSAFTFLAQLQLSDRIFFFGLSRFAENGKHRTLSLKSLQKDRRVAGPTQL
jgi:hypothetical protein